MRGIEATFGDPDDSHEWIIPAVDGAVKARRTNRASAYTRRITPTSRAALHRAREVRRDAQRLALHCAIWRSFADPDHDLRERVGLLRVPVLLTWGWADPVLPWLADGRRAARLLPGACVRTFACGHEPHAEVPEQWVAAVVPFLETLPIHGGR